MSPRRLPMSSPVEQRISLITLGVRDLPRACRFYENVFGWTRSPLGGDSVAFFQTGCVVFALWPREELAADAGISAQGNGFSGIALAHNVRERDQVDRVLAHVQAAGAQVVRPASDAFWGGRTGYFVDPDGFLWEVAWNPGFSISADGAVTLPSDKHGY